MNRQSMSELPNLGQASMNLAQALVGSPTNLCNEATQLKKDLHLNCDVMMVTALQNYTELPKR